MIRKISFQFTPKEDLGLNSNTLTPNLIWQREGCPVERLETINEDLLKLKMNTLSAIRKPETSLEEREKIAQDMAKMKYAIQSTKPSFPPPPDCIYQFEDDEPYVGTPGRWEERDPIERSWSSIVDTMEKLDERVIRSLNIQGTSFEEKEGLIFKKTVDEKVNEDFNKISKDMGYLISEANRIRRDGLTACCDPDAY